MGWVAGPSENKANRAQLELQLGLSLASPRCLQPSYNEYHEVLKNLQATKVILIIFGVNYLCE